MNHVKEAFFTMMCDDTTFGQHVRVVGGSARLGNWDPRYGLPLSCENEFPIWSARLLLYEGDAFEYKFVVCNDDGSAVRWEDHYNRIYCCGRGRGTARHLSRESCLANNTITLYHQTSPTFAASIMRSGRFERGSSGMAGGGIYFATSEAATYRKAHHRGAMISATVRLGRIKSIGPNEPPMNFHSLCREGYDSVRIPYLPSGPEFVVYNYDQVTNLRNRPV